MVKINKDMQAIHDKLIGYRKDPIGFATGILSLKPEYVWPKMREMAEGIRDHQLVCVRAGHSVSKTFSLGRVIVPWFKMCFQPSTVVTTAPSDNLVKNQLWREIHAAFSGAKVPLGGKMNTLDWDVKPTKEVLEQLEPEQREQWEKNFAIGFSTSPDSTAEHATKMQGWHNEFVLVVIDEACGIMPQIWRTAVEALITDDHCKLVAIGNPTDPECDFAKSCYSSDPEKNNGNAPYMSDLGFYVITISGKDTPNYKERRRVIPGLAGREFVERIEKKYGVNGDGTRYRVLGLFPTFKEGTYYGRDLAKARKEKRIGAYKWEESQKVYTFSDTGDMYTAVMFVQFLNTGIRIIDDYWDNEGLGLPNWAKVLQSKPYVYGGHFAGPELKHGTSSRFQTGRTTLDLASELGFDITPVLAHSFNDGIEAGRGIWGQLEINEGKCATYLKAAAGYGKKKNMALSSDAETVYHDSPAKTWHRHMMDAHRHLAMAYNYEDIGGQVLGFKGPIKKHDDDDYCEDEYQPMGLSNL